MFKTWIIGGAASALLFVAPAAVQAAPGSNAAGVRHATSMVEKVVSRRCWWRDGERYCSRRHARPRYRDYGYYYGRPRPEAFRTGSTAWWRAMDYEGRGGHGRTR